MNKDISRREFVTKTTTLTAAAMGTQAVGRIKYLDVSATASEDGQTVYSLSSICIGTRPSKA